MSLIFNRSFDPRHGAAVPVAPGVRRVTARNPGPFTFHGTNTFLIGEGALAVLDPGPADPAHIAALIRAIGDAEVAHILVSHTHRDHSPGARLLQAETGAAILAAGPHRPARSLAGLDEKQRPGSGGDLDFSPDVALADAEIVEGPGYRLQAVATPGHTANHLAFALLGADLLLSGDHVMGWATTIVAPPNGSMGDYMASLDKLEARPESRYLPAHGGAIEGAHSYVRGLRAHRQMRERAIMESLSGGDRSIAEIVTRVYDGLDPALVPAAALSTLAHLEYLVERGLAGSTEASSSAARYWLADPPRSSGDSAGDSTGTGAGGAVGLG